MAANAVFIAPLHGLDLHGPTSGRGFELDEGLYIASDSPYYDRLVARHFTESLDLRFRVYLQELQLEGIAKPPFLHTARSLPDTTKDLDSSGDMFLATWVYVNHALWLVKDNSVNFHRCAGSGTLATGRLIPWRGTLISYFFDASGEQHTTSISLDELRQARTYLRQLSEMALHLSSTTSDRGGVLLVKGHRLVRAQFFLMSARLHAILPLRIAQYVACLEALVSTDQSELKHRLCERIALFLASSGEEQERIYDGVSLAYSVRSAVVHGDRVKHEPLRLSDISRDCDDIIRALFRKILGDAELSQLFDECRTTKDSLDKYFKSKLFRSRR